MLPAAVDPLAEVHGPPEACIGMCRCWIPVRPSPSRTFGRLPQTARDSRHRVSEPLARARHDVSSCVRDARDACADGVCCCTGDVAYCVIRYEVCMGKVGIYTEAGCCGAEEALWVLV
jgi:hypothetical protein